MKTAAIIINFNQKNPTTQLLERIKNIPELPQIIINDNDSVDGSWKQLNTKYVHNRRISLIKNEKNIGFASGVNKCAKIAFGHGVDQILLLNPDLEISSEQIKKLVNCGKEIAGPVLKFKRNGEWVFDFGGSVSWFGRATHHESNQYPANSGGEIDYVSGACMLIKKDIFQKLGGFDEKFFLYFEDADLCLRARKFGVKSLLIQDLVVQHDISEHKNSGNKNKMWLAWKSNLYFVNRHVQFFLLPIAYLYLLLLAIKIGLNGQG